MLATSTLDADAFRPLTRRLYPVPPALEGVGRESDATPGLTGKQSFKRDVQPSFVCACHGTYEPVVGLGGFTIA